jgi:hypothetical protein
MAASTVVKRACWSTFCASPCCFDCRFDCRGLCAVAAAALKPGAVLELPAAACAPWLRHMAAMPVTISARYGMVETAATSLEGGCGLASAGPSGARHTSMQSTAAAGCLSR